ncbi:MAG: SH3 domain-containing protein [Pseudomonadota bacterium]
MIFKLGKISLLAFTFLATGNYPNYPFTNVAEAASTGKSGLPLPRYVSIKSKRVNMRIGPGKQYRVEWMFQKQGLPLEIIQEFENWRKVRDSEGSEGWILHSLLSGRRTVLVSPWEANEKTKLTILRKQSDASSAVVAKLEPGVLAKVQSCDDAWCKISIKKVEGFVEKDALWGVYPDEKIED